MRCALAIFSAPIWLVAIGAQAQFAPPSPCPAGNCSLATVTPSGGTTARTLAAITADVHNALAYGADPSGATDSTTQLAAALAIAVDGRYHDVFLPPGIYHITSDLVLNTNGTTGQCLRGANKTSTIITIGADYTAGAVSPIKLQGTAFGAPCLENIQLSFSQPASIGARSNFATIAAGCGTNGKGCEYPAAIDLSQAGNARLDNVLIANAWDCVHANWSISNGLTEIGNLSCGAFDRGLDLAGSVGIVDITNYHFYPWGITPANNTAIYQDGNTYAAYFVTMQGVTAHNFFSQDGRLSTSGGFGMQHFTNLEMDGDNATIEVSSGSWVTIAGGYSSGSATGANTACQLTVSAASVGVTAHTFSNDTDSTVPMICVSGGTLELTGSDMRLTGTGTSAVTESGGVMTLTGNLVELQNPGTWTAPLVSITGGQYTITGNTFGNGGGSGAAIATTVDATSDRVTDNAFMGSWTYTPSGPNGSYAGTSWIAFTPTIQCSTGALTAYTSAGAYQHVDKQVYLRESATLTTIGTCAGQLWFQEPVLGNNTYSSSGAGRDSTTGAALIVFQQGGTIFVTTTSGSDVAAGNAPLITLNYLTSP